MAQRMAQHARYSHVTGRDPAKHGAALSVEGVREPEQERGARQLNEVGKKGVVIGQPLFLLELGPLAIAGVGEEIDPLLRQPRAAGLIERLAS